MEMELLLKSLMKLLLKSIICCFMAANSLFASENIMDRLEGPDILASTKRLKTLFFRPTPRSTSRK